MFPHPVVSFLTYLEVHSSILRKNIKIPLFFYPNSKIPVFSRIFCLGSLAGVMGASWQEVPADSAGRWPGSKMPTAIEESADLERERPGGGLGALGRLLLRIKKIFWFVGILFGQKSGLKMILNLVASFSQSFSPSRATATHLRPDFRRKTTKNIKKRRKTTKHIKLKPDFWCFGGYFEWARPI